MPEVIELSCDALSARLTTCYDMLGTYVHQPAYVCESVEHSPESGGLFGVGCALTVVPEPAPWMAISLGLLALARWGRTKRR